MTDNESYKHKIITIRDLKDVDIDILLMWFGFFYIFVYIGEDHNESFKLPRYNTTGAHN